MAVDQSASTIRSPKTAGVAFSLCAAAWGSQLSRG